MTTECWYIKRTPNNRPGQQDYLMIFTQIISALALTAATVSAVDLKNKRCAPKHCKGINCLETLARISFEPKWCGAELMEKLARRSILRPEINWDYNPLYDANSPCDLLSQQDPSLSVAVVNSDSTVICSSFPSVPNSIYQNGTTDYSYPVHSAWSTNQVKYVNYDQQTIVAVPLYFRDGTVETAVFAKLNSELPVVCCDNPNPSLTQCRRFN